MTFSRSLVITLAISVLSASLVAQTHGANSAKRCSLATLKGTYGVLEEGTIVQQIPGFPPPPLPFAVAATVSFDGAGKLSGSATASINGFVNTGPVTGTYTVNPDCTYSDEFTDSLGFTNHHAGAIIGNGVFRKIQYIYTDAGSVAFGAAKKTLPGGCSLASLNGTYGFLERGTLTVQLPGFPPPPVPFVGAGTITYDGNGNASGSFTINIDGQTISSPGTGTYTVSPTCEYTDQLTASSGLAAVDAGAITGVGILQEVHYINSGGGFVSVGTAKK